MDIDLLKFISENLIVLIPILTGWGMIIKETEGVSNWWIPYILMVIALINTFMVQYLEEMTRFIIQAQFIAVFAVYGHKAFKRINRSDKTTN